MHHCIFLSGVLLLLLLILLLMLELSVMVGVLLLLLMLRLGGRCLGSVRSSWTTLDRSRRRLWLLQLLLLHRVPWPRHWRLRWLLSI